MSDTVELGAALMVLGRVLLARGTPRGDDGAGAPPTALATSLQGLLGPLGPDQVAAALADPRTLVAALADLVAPSANGSHARGAAPAAAVRQSDVQRQGGGDVPGELPTHAVRGPHGRFINADGSEPIAKPSHARRASTGRFTRRNAPLAWPSAPEIQRSMSVTHEPARQDTRGGSARVAAADAFGDGWRTTLRGLRARASQPAAPDDPILVRYARALPSDEELTLLAWFWRLAPEDLPVDPAPTRVTAAQRLGVTDERVRQILRKATGRVHALEDRGTAPAAAPVVTAPPVTLGWPVPHAAARRAAQVSRPGFQPRSVEAAVFRWLLDRFGVAGATYLAARWELDPEITAAYPRTDTAVARHGGVAVAGVVSAAHALAQMVADEAHLQWGHASLDAVRRAAEALNDRQELVVPADAWRAGCARRGLRTGPGSGALLQRVADLSRIPLPRHYDAQLDAWVSRGADGTREAEGLRSLLRGEAVRLRFALERQGAVSTQELTAVPALFRPRLVRMIRDGIATGRHTADGTLTVRAGHLWLTGVPVRVADEAHRALSAGARLGRTALPALVQAAEARAHGVASATALHLAPDIVAAVLTADPLRRFVVAPDEVRLATGVLPALPAGLEAALLEAVRVRNTDGQGVPPEVLTAELETRGYASGSLGRAATYAALERDPFGRFHLRGHAPAASGGSRGVEGGARTERTPRAGTWGTRPARRSAVRAVRAPAPDVVELTLRLNGKAMRGLSALPQSVTLPVGVWPVALTPDQQAHYEACRADADPEAVFLKVVKQGLRGTAPLHRALDAREGDLLVLRFDQGRRRVTATLRRRRGARGARPV